MIHKINILHRIVQMVNPHRIIRSKEGSSMKVMCCACHAFMSGDPEAVTISHGICVPCIKRLYPDLYEDFIKEEVRVAA